MRRFRDNGRLKWSVRPILSVGYGVHIVHGKDGRSTILKMDVDGWKTMSGISINTRWGAAWLYFRNWRCW